MRTMKYKTLISSAIAMVALSASAEVPMEYSGSLTAGAGSGDFAPYYINSLRHGRFTQPINVAAEASVTKKFNLRSRFSYGFGADLIAGYASSTDYRLYDAESSSWTVNPRHPARGWIQQFYGEVKYRGVFLLAGMKEHNSALLDEQLSSGDLVESGNARPIPEVRVGFVDFQNIPFTRGWVQIQGEIGYGKMLDSDWIKNRFNHFTGVYVDGEWYNYKRCYFRTKPSERFSVTVGMQAAATFGGTEYRYREGKLLYQRVLSKDAETFFKAFLPMPGGEEFYSGNHLGSWDFHARYTLRSGDRLMAYFQWPWEDGSGIGRRNGWDGLWGLEYRRQDASWLNGVVVEYLDFTNQSGPLHWAPGDVMNPTISSEATGADDYYNNVMYNSYAYYGMSIGSPALMAPIFDTDGTMKYIANRMRGFHFAANGNITPDLEWTFKCGYRRGYGNGRIMLPEPIHLTSVLVQGDWNVSQVRGLSLRGQLSLDRGNMPGNAFGAMVSVIYKGFVRL